ncbi:MAG: NAD(P)/FAD-dependent oxidoreductase, partial [Lysobacterales bacterium]
YDVPGIPSCTGQELVNGLVKQAAIFRPVFHLDQQAASLQRPQQGRWMVETSSGTRLIGASVVIAAGVGSFEPRRLRVAGAEAYQNQSLFYAVRNRNAFRGRKVVIAGGGDSALDWSVDLASIAQHITLVHRRDDFRAAPGTVSRLKDLVGAGRVDLVIGTPAALEGEKGKISAVQVKTHAGMQALECESLLVFYGLSPSLGPISGWGLNLDRNLIPVNTENFETSIPGLFAIGDICTYPGKLKLLLSGFHESALMAQQAFRNARPGQDLVFRHTTSNPEFQQLAGAA